MGRILLKVGNAKSIARIAQFQIRKGKEETLVSILVQDGGQGGSITRKRWIGQVILWNRLLGCFHRLWVQQESPIQHKLGPAVTTRWPVAQTILIRLSQWGTNLLILLNCYQQFSLYKHFNVFVVLPRVKNDLEDIFGKRKSRGKMSPVKKTAEPIVYSLISQANADSVPSEFNNVSR